MASAPKKSPQNAAVLLDLNNPEFQKALFNLPKEDLVQAVSTFRKLQQMSWQQLYADQGLKWEKITSITPPKGIGAIYSLRISQHRRALAYRVDDYLRLLTIPPDHDATYGKK